MTGTIHLYEMIAARDAMESWIDAFTDVEPDDVVDKVKRTVDVFNRVIEEMLKTKIPPVLTLVKGGADETDPD